MYLIPTDESFVEEIAKAIARARIHRDAASTLEQITGIRLDIHESLEDTFDRVFENLWAGQSEVDERQRDTYRQDALSAIRAINLKLLATPE